MIPMNNPIAIRILDGPEGGTVEVRIGTPVQDPEGPDWFTPWSISGLADGPIEFAAGGADSMQSLIHALAMVGDVIGAEPEPITFFGGPSALLRTALGGDPGMWVATVQESTLYALPTDPASTATSD